MALADEGAGSGVIPLGAAGVGRAKAFIEGVIRVPREPAAGGATAAVAVAGTRAVDGALSDGGTLVPEGPDPKVKLDALNVKIGVVALLACVADL